MVAAQAAEVPAVTAQASMAFQAATAQAAVRAAEQVAAASTAQAALAASERPGQAAAQAEESAQAAGAPPKLMLHSLAWGFFVLPQRLALVHQIHLQSFWVILKGKIAGVTDQC